MNLLDKVVVKNKLDFIHGTIVAIKGDNITIIFDKDRKIRGKTEKFLTVKKDDVVRRLTA